MQSKLQIRSWRWAVLCGLLVFAISVLADTSTPTQKAPASKKTHCASTHSPSSPHSTVSTKHAVSSHASVSRSSTKHSSGKSTHKGARGKTKARTKFANKRGQKVIDSERARQIQEALIREHYLQGEPNGTWDSATQAAMQRYQADQGWQSKTTPDARALIKLGLGPSPEHLLNPESAMTSARASTAADSNAAAKANGKPNSTDPLALPSSKTPAGDTPQQ